MRYQELADSVNQILDQYDMDLTIRQIYYRLVSPPFQVIPNTRSSYTNYDRQMVKARELEDVDDSRIVDRSRNVLASQLLSISLNDISPTIQAFISGDQGYDSVDDFIAHQLMWLQQSYKCYTKRLWTSQGVDLEVWVEKDALASVIFAAANPLKVLVAPSRGYSSYQFIKEGLERSAWHGRDRIILHFADHDPSGLDMSRDLERRIRKYGGGIEVIRVALNYDQVKQFDLAPNPVKTADTRSSWYLKEYGNECWELDALPPDELQRIVREAIEQYVEPSLWNKAVEESKREQATVKQRIEQLLERLGATEDGSG